MLFQISQHTSMYKQLFSIHSLILARANAKSSSFAQPKTFMIISADHPLPRK